MKTKQYCKIIKEWGGFPIGHELWIGEPKAGGLEVSGFVKLIKPPTEQAMLNIKAKQDAKATAKARADAARKAKAEAKAKAKAEKEDKAKAEAKAEKGG